MLRKILDYQLALVENNKYLSKIHPLIAAGDTFFYEAPNRTQKGPHIRDAVDLKRWMILVVFALIPCILMAMWNTGLQSFVYSSGDYKLMDEYLSSLGSLSDYFAFVGKDNRWMTILATGAYAFLPIMIISYAVGGLCEGIFACIRKHDIAEGFLVTGMLYPLVLPPTIPYWMAAVGVAAGIVIGKELFGGTGMNIMNPALCCRAFMFFTFPGRMSGDVWVGTNTTTVRESLIKMNQEAGKGVLDAYSQATPLAKFNISMDIKRVHVDAIASNNIGDKVSTFETVKQYFQKWISTGSHDGTLGDLTADQLRQFVTGPLKEGGLGLSPGSFEDAYQFAGLNYGIGPLNNDWGFILGNKLGCMGETSVIACLLGALFIIYTAVGSWRTMLAMGLGVFITASLFQMGSTFLGADGGAWAPAQFGLPAYKHIIIGGLAFGLVFMATDPVSSPDMDSAKWIYGLFIGLVTVVIRTINPAYPEGVMLAIILGNCFHPLFDYYAAKIYRRRAQRARRTATA